MKSFKSFLREHLEENTEEFMAKRRAIRQRLTANRNARKATPKVDQQKYKIRTDNMQVWRDTIKTDKQFKESILIKPDKDGSYGTIDQPKEKPKKAKSNWNDDVPLRPYKESIDLDEDTLTELFGKGSLEKIRDHTAKRYDDAVNDERPSQPGARNHILNKWDKTNGLIKKRDGLKESIELDEETLTELFGKGSLEKIRDHHASKNMDKKYGDYHEYKENRAKRLIARRNGKTDRQHGYSQKDNPHEPGTKEYYAWNQGNSIKEAETKTATSLVAKVAS